MRLLNVCSLQRLARGQDIQAAQVSGFARRDPWQGVPNPSLGSEHLAVLPVVLGGPTLRAIGQNQ